MYLIKININYYTNVFNPTTINTNTNTDKDIPNYNYWITIDYPIPIRFIRIKETDLNTLYQVNVILFYITFLLVLFGLISYIGEIRQHKNYKSVSLLISILRIVVSSFEFTFD